MEVEEREGKVLVKSDSTSVLYHSQKVRGH